MNLKSIKIYVFVLTAACVRKTAIAQKNIAINDSLSANAEVLKVKMGSSFFGKMQKFRFGDYAVVSGKVGWTTTSSSSNFLETKTESKSAQKFSFVLTDGGTDLAKVNAARNIQLQTHNSIRLFDNFTWGDDELLRQSMNFSAYISLNNDTSVSWVLIMKGISGSETPGRYSAFLTDGHRRIQIFPVSAESTSKNTMLSGALGYEFAENGHSFSALQYWGGGVFPLNRNIIWLNRSLDPQLKLVLSAAMVAILEMKLQELEQ
jgi:hypothetical protein